VTVRCALGTLTPGQLVHVTIHATVAPEAPADGIANVATVAADQRDPDPSNDRASASLTVRQTAHVTLSKRLVGTPRAGERVAWHVTAVNHGPHAADGLVIVDPLPGALHGPSATAVGGSGQCAVVARVARCTLHALGVGQRAEIRVAGRLSAHAGGTFLDNGAELFEHEADPSPRGAISSEQVVVHPAADVEIAADATPRVPVPGQTLTYHLRVEDLGPEAATGVRFEERLPAGVAPVSVPDGCRVTGRLVRCRVGRLRAGAARTYDLVVRLGLGTAGARLGARVSVAAGRADPASADNRDVVRTAVGPAPRFTG
jgi:uncharacterized repeat protein (TIGR01451 family)